MIKLLFSFVFTVVALAVSGCATEDMGSSARADGSDGMASPSFAQFNDIPIPEKASMDLRQTLLLGGSSSWIGRLVFVAPYTQNNLFDFYMSEMPKFGWTELTVVRSKVSILSYRMDNRVATVQIESDVLNGASVSITVSPYTEKRTSAPQSSEQKIIPRR